MKRKTCQHKRGRKMKSKIQLQTISKSVKPSKFFWIPLKKKKKHKNIALEMLSGKVQCASLSKAASVPYTRTCGVPNGAVAPPPVKWKVWHFGWYSNLISGWEENWRIHHFGLSSAPRRRSYSTTGSCGKCVQTAGSLSPLQLANCCGCYISSPLMSTTTYECDSKLFHNKLWAGTIPSLPIVLNMETVLCFPCTNIMMYVAGLQIRLCEEQQQQKKRRWKRHSCHFAASLF